MKYILHQKPYAHLVLAEKFDPATMQREKTVILGVHFLSDGTLLETVKRLNFGLVYSNSNLGGLSDNDDNDSWPKDYRFLTTGSKKTRPSHYHPLAPFASNGRSRFFSYPKCIADCSNKQLQKLSALWDIQLGDLQEIRKQETSYRKGEHGI